jgi:hypothetical protein
VALEDILKAPVVKPVFIGFFDITSDPIRAWTGPGTFAPSSTGDADLDGHTFGEAIGIVQVSDFTESQGLADEWSISFSVGDANLDPFTQLVVDRRVFVGRKAVVWRGFLLADESGVSPYINRVFTGVMVGATMERQAGGASIITLTCDQDLQKASQSDARLIDHQFFYPGDTASSFMANLSRGSGPTFG